MTREKYLRALAVVAECVDSGLVDEEQAVADLRSVCNSHRDVAADGSVETLMAILDRLRRDGRVSTPGYIVEAIQKVNANARVSAQGVASRITHSKLIGLETAVFALSGLKPERNGKLSISAKTKLHSVVEDRDVDLTEVLDRVHVPYEKDPDNGKIFLAQENVADGEEVAEILRSLKRPTDTEN